MTNKYTHTHTNTISMSIFHVNLGWPSACLIFLLHLFLVISPKMTCKTGQMSVCASVHVVSIFP